MTKRPFSKTVRKPLDPKCYIYVVFWKVLVVVIFWPFPVAFAPGQQTSNAKMPAFFLDHLKNSARSKS